MINSLLIVTKDLFELMKNYIVVTGGAGFVGSNLIEFFIKKEKKYCILSIDNYSTGKKKKSY